jgi:hypothetical protein
MAYESRMEILALPPDAPNPLLLSRDDPTWWLPRQEIIGYIMTIAGIGFVLGSIRSIASGD